MILVSSILFAKAPALLIADQLWILTSLRTFQSFSISLFCPLHFINGFLERFIHYCFLQVPSRGRQLGVVILHRFDVDETGWWALSGLINISPGLSLEMHQQYRVLQENGQVICGFKLVCVHLGFYIVLNDGRADKNEARAVLVKGLRMCPAICQR